MGGALIHCVENTQPEVMRALEQRIRLAELSNLWPDTPYQVAHDLVSGKWTAVVHVAK